MKKDVLPLTTMEVIIDYYRHIDEGRCHAENIVHCPSALYVKDQVGAGGSTEITGERGLLGIGGTALDGRRGLVGTPRV